MVTCHSPGKNLIIQSPWKQRERESKTLFKISIKTYKDRVSTNSPQSFYLFLSQPGSFLGLLQLLLGLPELGQVKGGDLLGLLDLLIISY